MPKKPKKLLIIHARTQNKTVTAATSLAVLDAAPEACAGVPVDEDEEGDGVVVVLDGSGDDLPPELVSVC